MHSIEDSDHFDTCDPVSTIKHLSSLTSPSAAHLELLANAHLSLGEIECAHSYLLAAIQSCPLTGHTKYLTLAQLLTGSDSLDALQRGLELVPSQDIRCRSAIYTAMAEIYLTDLCEIDEAQQKCRGCLDTAVSIDNSNPEVWSTFASFYLSICEESSAVECCGKSMDLINQVGFENVGASEKIALVKLLVECGLNDRAIILLDDLSTEDDTDLEVWYLYGVCYYRMGESSCDESVKNTAWDNSRDCLARTIDGDVEDPMIQHAKELHGEVNEYLDSIGWTYDDVGE